MRWLRTAVVLALGGCMAPTGGDMDSDEKFFFSGCDWETDPEKWAADGCQDDVADLSAQIGAWETNFPIQWTDGEETLDFKCFLYAEANKQSRYIINHFRHLDVELRCTSDVGPMNLSGTLELTDEEGEKLHRGTVEGMLSSSPGLDDRGQIIRSDAQGSYTMELRAVREGALSILLTHRSGSVPRSLTLSALQRWENLGPMMSTEDCAGLAGRLHNSLTDELRIARDRGIQAARVIDLLEGSATAHRDAALAACELPDHSEVWNRSMELVNISRVLARGNRAAGH